MDTYKLQLHTPQSRLTPPNIPPHDPAEPVQINDWVLGVSTPSPPSSPAQPHSPVFSSCPRIQHGAPAKHDTDLEIPEQQADYQDLDLPPVPALNLLSNEDRMAVYFMNDAHNLARSEAIFAEELYHQMVNTTEDYKMRADKALNKFRTIKSHARVCIAHAYENISIEQESQDSQMEAVRDESTVIDHHQQVPAPAVKGYGK